LNNPDAEIRARAVYALGFSGHAEAVGPIVQLLQTDETRVKTLAAIALGRCRDIGAVPALVNALEDKNPGVRFEAASSLLALDCATEAAKGALLELYKMLGTHALWARQIIKCLMTKPDEKIFAVVVEACENKSSDIREIAYSVLDRIHGNIDDLLIKGLREKSRGIRFRAADILVARHGERALRWLAEAFEENPSERASILESIDRRYGDDGREFLIQVLESGMDQHVRALAAKQLSRRARAEISAVLATVLRKADSAREPILVSELIWGLRDSADREVVVRIKSIAEDQTVAKKLRERAGLIVANCVAGGRA
jgi:HEAT repeat protein